MNLVLDTCSIINLVNGEIFEKILGLPGHKFFVGSMVYNEFTKDQNHSILTECISNGNVSLLNEDHIDLTLFQKMLDKYKLGDGETECLCYATNLGLGVVSDDKKARLNIIKEIGKTRVVGSLYLLNKGVKENLLSCQRAQEIYMFMKVSGGFLPNINRNQLCD